MLRHRLSRAIADCLFYSCSRVGTIYFICGVFHDLVVVCGWTLPTGLLCVLMLHIFDGFIVFQVLRVYAISGLKWHLALLVGMFSVVPLSYSIVSTCFVPCRIHLTCLDCSNKLYLLRSTLSV